MTCQICFGSVILLEHRSAKKGNESRVSVLDMRRHNFIMQDREIICCLRDRNSDRRHRGLMEIAHDKNFHHKDAVAEIMLHDKEDPIRALAAWVLDELNLPESVPYLLQALTDPFWEVRSNAGWALVHLGPDVAYPLNSFIAENGDQEAVEMARLVVERVQHVMV